MRCRTSCLWWPKQSEAKAPPRPASAAREQERKNRKAFRFWRTRYMVRTVIGPVRGLEAVARNLSKGGNYALRLNKQADDEVGELTECFNNMLARLAERDRQLRRHGEHLEEQVKLRTS